MNSKRRDRKGFTLIELMITVAIIGVLAAVAIPIFIDYITTSKAAEASSILLGIRMSEETYHTNFKRYTGDLDWEPRNPADCTTDTVMWNSIDATWIQLGFAPDGPTYYSYRVTTNYNADGTVVAGADPTTNFDEAGTTWPATPGDWFVAEAEGDIDCDKIHAKFYISSHNKTVFHDVDTTGQTY